MEKYLQLDLYLVFRYLNTYIDHKNYNNPIVKYIDTFTTQIGSLFGKRSYFRFIRNKLIDDNGLFIESYNTIKYINLQAIVSDVIPTSNSQLFNLTLESMSIATKTIRAYMKIQELIAKIGGLFNGFRIIVMILINGYVSFSYYSKIFETIEKKKNKKSNKSINQLINLGKQEIEVEEGQAKRNNYININKDQDKDKDKEGNSKVFFTFQKTTSKVRKKE